VVRASPPGYWGSWGGEAGELATSSLPALLPSPPIGGAMGSNAPLYRYPGARRLQRLARLAAGHSPTPRNPHLDDRHDPGGDRRWCHEPRPTRVARLHSRIENRSPGVLDAPFDEDRSHVRCGRSPAVEECSPHCVPVAGTQLVPGRFLALSTFADGPVVRDRSLGTPESSVTPLFPTASKNWLNERIPKTIRQPSLRPQPAAGLNRSGVERPGRGGTGPW
jgi:hypothetical protein